MSLPTQTASSSPSGASPVDEMEPKATLISTQRSDEGSTLDDADLDDDLFGNASQRTHSSALDRKDMHRLGKPQEFSRNYRALSTLSFTIVVQGTWEFILLSMTQGLTNGGLAGLFWSYVWTFVGFTPIVASLAEMASMAPTSGGQYHWVSEFAPERYQKILSYVTGWQSTLGWQAGNASGSFLTGTIIQGLIAVNNPSYASENWQGTLLVFASVSLVYISNVWGARALPHVQNTLLIIHVFAFFSVIICLWVTAEHQPPSAVFTQFTNGGNWSSIGLSLMVGQLSAVWGLIGSDAAAHMAEEVRDAAVAVPRAMFWSFIMNGILGLGLVVSVLFSIPSLSDALNDPSGYPFIYVFREAMGTTGVNALTAVILVLVFASNVSYNASTARETWAFGRDDGLPFGKWIAHVHPKLRIPVRAIALSCIISCLLAVLNVGSNVAFNAIISLNASAIMISYATSIGCVLWRRLTCPESLPPARWSLGRWGLPINIAGFLYSTFTFFWSFWPPSTPTTAEDFNWSSVIFGGVTAISVAWYLFRGRVMYTGPVVLVVGRQSAAAREMSSY